MWIYSQNTGSLWCDNGLVVAKGYSGHGKGKNNPGKEYVKSVGPIPRGLWVIGEAYRSKKVGPLAIILEPSGHDAHGRTYFRIHGDSFEHPGQASKGCIVLSRSIRQQIIDSNDKILRVIE